MIYHVIEIEWNPRTSAAHAEEIIRGESENQSPMQTLYEGLSKDSRIEVTDSGEMMHYFLLKQDDKIIHSSYELAQKNRMNLVLQ